MSQSRIYISNLSFDATENELFGFLEDFKVVSVLIPSQTVRGLTNHAVRPFGIAYAEFENEEDAEKAIHELNGKQFMERTLHIRKHIPIDSSKIKVVRKPSVKGKAKKHRFSPFKKSNNQDGIEASNNMVQSTVADEVVGSNAVEPDIIPELQVSPQEKPASENIAFIGFIPRNTTDEQLRDYFKEFEPQEIVVFKNRMFRRGFSLHRHFTGALVTFQDGQILQNAREFASQNKFKGKLLVVKNAYLDKIKEVKKALEKKIADVTTENEPVEVRQPTEESQQSTDDQTAVEVSDGLQNV